MLFAKCVSNLKMSFPLKTFAERAIRYESEFSHQTKSRTNFSFKPKIHIQIETDSYKLPHYTKRFRTQLKKTSLFMTSKQFTEARVDGMFENK